jgi:hypothetical protein
MASFNPDFSTKGKILTNYSKIIAGVSAGSGSSPKSSKLKMLQLTIPPVHATVGHTQGEHHAPFSDGSF